jgi:3-hydroxyisobutyrate dehydrogenase-like beta-hydroxyacid dehydrogenase
MGEPIASRLLDAGHAVTVFNRTPGRADGLVERGATRAGSPRGVWESADACITMIVDDGALLAVMLADDGLLGEGPPGRVVIDMSTVSVDASRAVAEAAQAAGIGYLRAPVSGNPSVVEAGNLTIMVSGDGEAFERLQPALRDIGPHVFYFGAGEEARVMKLALNLMVAATAEMMAEALVLGESSGLERAAMLEVMGASAVGSPFVKYKTAALVSDDYTATFTSTMMHKDLSLALDAGRAVGVPLPVTDLVRGLLEDCIATGLGDADLMALLPRLAREAGRATADGRQRLPTARSTS